MKKAVPILAIFLSLFLGTPSSAVDCTDGTSGPAMLCTTDDKLMSQQHPYHDKSEALSYPHGWPVDSTGAELVTLTYSASTRKVTLTAVSGGSFDIWVRGTKTNILSPHESLAHDATEGTWFYYFNGTNWVWSQTFQNLYTNAPTAYVYYSSIKSSSVGFFELHKWHRDIGWHYNRHLADGTLLISGGTLGDYTLATQTDAAIQFSITETVIADEDIFRTLTARADGAGYTIWRRSGTSGYWTWDTSTTLPFLYGTYPQRNYNAGGGTGWTMADIAGTSGGNYVTAYVVATPALDSAHRFIIIPGQTEYTTLAAAMGEIPSSLSLGNFPFAEASPIAQLVIHARVDFGGTAKAELAAVTKLIGTRGSLSVPATNGLTGSGTANYIPKFIGATSLTNSAMYETAATEIVSTLQLRSSAAVVASETTGFYNRVYTINAANPIWAFANATAYGLSYYQYAGTPTITWPTNLASDAIGFKFGSQPTFYVTAAGKGYFKAGLYSDAGNATINAGNLLIQGIAGGGLGLTASSETTTQYPYIAITRNCGTAATPAACTGTGYYVGASTYNIWGPGGVTLAGGFNFQALSFNGNYAVGKLVFSISDEAGGTKEVLVTTKDNVAVAGSVTAQSNFLYCTGGLSCTGQTGTGTSTVVGTSTSTATGIRVLQGVPITISNTSAGGTINGSEGIYFLNTATDTATVYATGTGTNTFTAVATGTGSETNSGFMAGVGTKTVYSTRTVTSTETGAVTVFMTANSTVTATVSMIGTGSNTVTSTVSAMSGGTVTGSGTGTGTYTTVATDTATGPSTGNQNYPFTWTKTWTASGTYTLTVTNAGSYTTTGTASKTTTDTSTLTGTAFNTYTASITKTTTTTSTTVSSTPTIVKAIGGKPLWMINESSSVATYDDLSDSNPFYAQNSSVPTTYAYPYYWPTSSTSAVSVSSGLGEVLVKSFVAKVNVPGVVYPPGEWEFTTSWVTSIVGSTNYVVHKVYKRNIAGTETLLFSATSSAFQGCHSECSAQPVSTVYTAAEQSLLPSDKLVVKIYITTTDVAAKTMTMYWGRELGESSEGGYASYQYAGWVTTTAPLFALPSRGLKQSLGNFLRADGSWAKPVNTITWPP